MILAIVYLAVVVLVGDTLAHGRLGAVSRPHRLTAFLVGLLVTTWIVFLAGLAAASSDRPLAVSAAVVLGAIGPLVVLVRWMGWRSRRADAAPTASRAERGDWITLGLITVGVTWMFTTTFGAGDGELLVGIHEIGDFGPALALVQGFAIGHNLPPEYPLFAGEPILYHFLFYLAAGQLVFLGMDAALAINVLGIGSMVAMLTVLMAIGQRAFGTPVVGRVAAGLFFVHGSLSFIPFLASFPSLGAALEALPRLDQFLSSPFPYRGETWAIWSQNVFLNQRHLASGIGIVLIVVGFVVDRARRAEGVLGEGMTLARPAGYVLCGLLAGLLPFWNSALYVIAAAILGALFLLERAQWRGMLILAGVAGMVSIPQVLALRPDSAAVGQFPILRWGYVVDDPTPWNVAAYLGFLFGPKLLLAGFALVGGDGLQRRLFLAASALVAIPFLTQLTSDVSNGHKFLSVWLIIVNLYAAAGLIRLWNRGVRWRDRPTAAVPRRMVAGVLAAVIVIGGVIDLVPIANDPVQRLSTTADPVYEWVREETDPRAVFLSDVWIHHQVLRAGRRIYLGWPAYPFSMGYDMSPREGSYRDLLSSTSARDVVRGLQEAGIDYVAFDDGLREGTFVGAALNEDLYRAHLEVVYLDDENRHRNLTIYRVPTDRDAWRALPGAEPVNLFAGQQGDGPGQLDGPRGIAVGGDRTILVADTGNHRVQRFTSDGTFIDEFGTPGTEVGQFDEPFGVAVDDAGRIHVVEAATSRLQAFDGEGRPIDLWTSADPMFYGPRDVAVGPDDTVFVLDQGRARVVARDTSGREWAFGVFGSGPGEVNDPTGLGVGAGIVAVADPTNRRIVVFAEDGTFLRAIEVPEWGTPFEYPDVVVDPSDGTILASSPGTGEIVAFAPDGSRVGPLAASLALLLAGPSAMALDRDGTLLVIDRPGDRVVRLDR